MYHNLFVVVSLIYFSSALCDNFNPDRPSRGFVSNLIKYLDNVFDFLYQTFVGKYDPKFLFENTVRGDLVVGVTWFRLFGRIDRRR